MTRLVLASQSPRRRQLLQQFDIPFEVVVADIDEQPLENESPGEMTLRLARQKAQAVLATLGSGYAVLGGDTTVAIDDQILGKPADREAAMTILKTLSGRTHRVYSGVALVDQNGCDTRLCTTHVTFSALTDQQISDYCNSGEPYDKAGAYGIQGRGGRFVSALDGSYSGVVGLPLWETHQLLKGRDLQNR